MLNVRVFQLILIYLSGSVLQAEAAKKPQFSRDLQVNTHNGVISVPSGFSLYTIAMTNKTVHVNSSDPAARSCNFNIDPFEESIIAGFARATLSDRNNQIIVWGVRAEEAGKAYFSLLTIDPKKCSYDAVEEMPDDERLEAHNTTLPLVIGKQYGFLVFFSSQRHCWPCSFNAYAKIFDQENLMLERESTPAASVHLQPFDLKNPARGEWFYAHNFANNTAVVKIVDQKFNITRRAYVDFRVEDVSANHGIIRNSGTCSTDTGKIVCRRFDSRLRVVQSIVISTPTTISRVSLEYDSGGSWFIAAAVGLNIQVFIYNVDGQSVDTLDFGQVEPGYKIHEFRG